MLDYHAIIAALNPSGDQVEEATKYALAIITEEVHETHPDAVVLVEEGCVHVVSEENSDDLIFPLQYSFAILFADKIYEIQGKSQEPMA